MPSHATQEERILALLNANFGRDVALPDILSLRIAQYNARIKGLRRKGYDIRSRTEWNGTDRHTWFRLVGLPMSPDTVNPTSPKDNAPTSRSTSTSAPAAPETRGGGEKRNGGNPWRGTGCSAAAARSFYTANERETAGQLGSARRPRGGCIYSPCKCRA